MKLRKAIVSTFALMLMLVMAVPAMAGNPHFVGDPTITREGDALIVTGKVAGLGNEAQIFVSTTALAECVNRGNRKPSADNKDEVSAGNTFPVQNGKANFTVTLDGGAQIDPACSPPMRIEYSDVVVEVFLTDAEGNPVGDAILTYSDAGPF